jgi:FkbM family methyltransferase
MMDLSILESKFKYTPKKVLDIGCNVGQFYLHAKQYWPKAKFFLVDGNESVREDLTALNVSFQIMLLADTVKKVNLYKNSKNPKCTGTSIYRENTEHYKDGLVIIEEKMTTTLDIIFPDFTFGLIKLDTQGSEIDILNGGQKMMLEADFIIMETSLIEWNLNSPKEEEVIKYMDQHGYIADTVIGQHYLEGNLFQQDILFRNGFK